MFLERNISYFDSNLVIEINNTIIIRKNQLELRELKNMLNRTESFLSETQFSLNEQASEETRLLEDVGERDNLLDAEEQSYGSMKFNITAGVIDRMAILLLWIY